MILVIETVQAACSVALIDEQRIIDERHEIVGRGHAEALVPMIAELLEGRIPHAILADCGPGSFTGVRVGLAAARALALAWDIPASGYSSMALLAASVFAEAETQEPLTVALAGGHGELFVQRFAPSPFVSLTELQSLTPEHAAGTLPADRLIVGSGAAMLAEARGSGEVDLRWPRAADARLLPIEWRGLPMRPIYGRAPDARPAAS